jgi:tRNA(fMet)-specific endonuclease VapC
MPKLKYLLDTNILSELIKNPSGRVANKIIELDDSSFCTSIIIACELRYGAKKKNSAPLTQRIESLLSNILILPLEDNIDSYYADLRATLEKKGDLIGSNDMLIAAHALALNLILVTANERGFLRVPHLKVENWLQATEIR